MFFFSDHKKEIFVTRWLATRLGKKTKEQMPSKKKDRPSSKKPMPATKKKEGCSEAKKGGGGRKKNSNARHGAKCMASAGQPGGVRKKSKLLPGSVKPRGGWDLATARAVTSTVTCDGVVSLVKQYGSL